MHVCMYVCMHVCIDIVSLSLTGIQLKFDGIYTRRKNLKRLLTTLHTYIHTNIHTIHFHLSTYIHYDIYICISILFHWSLLGCSCAEETFSSAVSGAGMLPAVMGAAVAEGR